MFLLREKQREEKERRFFERSACLTLWPKGTYLSVGAYLSVDAYLSVGAYSRI